MSRQLIGVDVGGTKVSVASLQDGELSEPRTEPTEKSSADALVDQIARVIEEARGPDAAAVGIGIPSAVEFATGKALSGVNVPLEGVPLRALLTERLGLPVFVDNDASCAALAEAHDGDRLIARHLVMFTVGTGVGGGLVLDGRLYRGATGAAGEMGHILIGLDLEEGAPEPTGFPQRGSLEFLSAGRALDRMAAAAAAAEPDSALGRLASEGTTVTGREAVQAAMDGDPGARRLVEVLGERLGIGIASAINLFDPELVVIGGGVAAAGDLLRAPAEATARKFVLPGVGRRTQIVLARYGNDAGVRGATLLAGQEVGP